MRGCVPKISRNIVAVAAVALAFGVLSDTADAGRRQSEQPDVQPTLSGSPVMAIVSLRDQRVSLYDANGAAMRARVSTGQTGLDTPVGIYSVIGKEEEHYSNVYDDAAMPFMQRITWSGIALHAGVIPGYPASHGCVRLPYDFAQQIFPLTHLNMRVIISYADVAPVPFSHPLLMKPAPSGEAMVATPAVYDNDAQSDQTNPFQPDVRNWPSREAQLDLLKADASARAVEADDAIANVAPLKRLVNQKKAEAARLPRTLQYLQSLKKQADDKLTRADRLMLAAKTPAALKNAESYKSNLMADWRAVDARLDALQTQIAATNQTLAAVTSEWAAADAIRVKAVAASQDAIRKTLPVSILISLKTQRIYVRQGNEPVFDAPVTIANPETPIGTHIFTAVDYTDEGRDLRWTAVSIGRRTPEDVALAKKARFADLSADARATDPGPATAALDRITISPDVASRISTYVWPGSSLIVSDEEAHKETGSGTDFIVLISGEPQGGIKRRPKQPTFRIDRDDPWRDEQFDSRGRRIYKPNFFSFW